MIVMNNSKIHTLIKNVAINFDKGLSKEKIIDIHLVYGNNGSGKTQLFNILTSLNFINRYISINYIFSEIKK